MISRLRTTAALLGVALLAGCTTPQKTEKTAAYAVNLAGGTAEIDHPGYDPELGGYWIVGYSVTMKFMQVRNQPIPESFSFMLRTKPDASLGRPSQLDYFKIISKYNVVTRFNDGTLAPVDILTLKGDILVKTDTTGKYIRFERVGERIKVTLTKECLTQLIDTDAVISWSDKQTAPKRSANESESWRRVL